MIDSTTTGRSPSNQWYDPGDRWVPVDRRWLGLDRATVVPALVVLAVAFVMAVVLPALNTQTAYDDRVAEGDVLELGGGIEFDPAVGWGITSGVRAADRPASGSFPPQAVVEGGGVSLTIRTGEFDGDAYELLDQIRSTSKALDSDLVIEGNAVETTTASGERGVITRISSSQVDGTMAAFVIDGHGVQVTAVGPAGTERGQADAVARMISSIRPVEEASR
ncbi:hypothetical protein [Rhodococcus gannanensis]|uniref:DUF4245 domain-containing protein n=1 Tax=Rhodococcus gannanensis TaxID=1960308 RepID=A0ABW4P3A2_9NOCA